MMSGSVSVQAPLRINKLVIFGLGLIGGSFALALKKAGVVKHVLGFDRDEASLQMALAMGLIDTIASSLEDAIRGADLILLAAPVAQTGKILAAIYPYLQSQTMVTDAGSTKSDVVAAARLALHEKIGQFVPAHPIAGREKNGPSAALVDLYVGKKVVVTRLPENTQAAVDLVANAWQACHAIIHHLSPQEHDRVFASVSHLPHLLAYALVDDIAAKPHADLLFQYAASGFRDFTRIAGSSPEMWRDICTANQDAIVNELDAYLQQLTLLREYLVQGDKDNLEIVFKRAQSARVNWGAAIELAELQSRDGGD